MKIYKRAKLRVSLVGKFPTAKWLGEFYVHLGPLPIEPLARLSGPEYMHGLKRRRLLSSDGNKTRGRARDGRHSTCNVGRSHIQSSCRLVNRDSERVRHPDAARDRYTHRHRRLAGRRREAAVAEAWAAYKPESKRPIKLVTPRPAREGWDEREVFDYETSPNERAAVQALALRAGNRWTVIILDGTDPTVEKRSAPIGLVFESLRPKDYKRESFAGRTPHPLDAAHIDQLKAFVETSMQQLGIPGASMALIDHGKIVYQGGFGVRELGKPEKVDENTVFMAASNTKGMTTLLLAELVDEKKLKWDEPVVDVYPSFKLGDADTTKKVLVKNLICACTGVPRQDLEWLFEFKNATPETELALLGTMQPTSKFGEVFQYSNLMAAAAGYIGAHLVIPTWNSAPLMTRRCRKRFSIRWE